MKPELNAQWYMVNGTKMKGPLSWDQVLLEHQEEIIQKETLLWTQGLSEWQSFDSIKVSRSAPTPPQAPPFIRPAKPLPTPQPNFAFRKKARASKAKRFILTALCVVAFVPAARTVYLHYNQNEKLLEMVRHDLTASDFIKAQNFISQSTASVPETLIFAKAKAGLMPEFYFFAPLPDQQLVDFVLQGQPGDLLGKVRYQAVQTLPILNRMAKSSAFVQSNQAPLAQGIYSITLQDHLTKKPLATQSYFIGGQRDEDFEQRIHVYRLKLKRQANSEISDLNQWLDSLHSQLQATHKIFERANLRPGDEQESTWSTFQKEMTQTLAALTEFPNQDKLYYLEHYEELKGLSDSLSTLHEHQVHWIQAVPRDQKEANKITEEEDSLQERIQTLSERLHGGT